MVKGERGHSSEEARQQIATARETMRFRPTPCCPLIFPSRMQRARNARFCEALDSTRHRVCFNDALILGYRNDMIVVALPATRTASSSSSPAFVNCAASESKKAAARATKPPSPVFLMENRVTRLTLAILERFCDFYLRNWESFALYFPVVIYEDLSAKHLIA